MTGDDHGKQDRHVHAKVERTHEDGTVFETEVIVDLQTGNTVASGDQMSENATEFFDMFAAVAQMMRDDPDIDTSDWDEQEDE